MMKFKILVCVTLLFFSCKHKNSRKDSANPDKIKYQNSGIQSYNDSLRVLLIAEHSLEINHGLGLTEGKSDHDLLTILLPSLLGVAIAGGAGAYTFKRFWNREGRNSAGNSQANPQSQNSRNSDQNSSFNPQKNLLQIKEAVETGDSESALLKHQELDEIYSNIQSGRLGIQTINTKMDLLSYSDLVDDPALIKKSLGENQEGFIVYNPSMSDIPSKLGKYYDIELNPNDLPPYLSDYQWKVVKIKSKLTPPARALTPKEIELFGKIDSEQPVRGRFSNLMWTHNMPSSTFLDILEGPIKLKSFGAKGLQFRYGLDSQYGDISFILKNRPLSYWHSKPGIIDDNKALFLDPWNKKQISESEISNYLKEQANNFGFTGEGRTRDAEHYHTGSGACVSRSIGRPVWCNLQFHINSDIGPKDIGAIILPGFLRPQTSKIQKQLPEVELLFNDNIPSKEYHDYYPDPSPELEGLVSSGSIEKAVKNGVMRSPFVEGNSSTVSLSKRAYIEAQKVYMKYITKHADQYDADQKPLAGIFHASHHPLPFNAKEINELKMLYDIPYSGRVQSPDDYYPKRQGVVRANHGIAHALRQGAIAVDMINILKKYGADDHKLSNWIRTKSSTDPFFEKKIEMAAIYQRSGRTDESSPSNAIYAYAPQGKASADNFRHSAQKSGIFTEQEIRMYERAIMRDEILQFHQSQELLHLRKNPSENPDRLSKLESIAGKQVNGQAISDDGLLGFVQNLDGRGGPLSGDEIMIDHLIHASHMADLRRLNRNWNTPELVPNEIAKNLGLRMDILDEKTLVDEIYYRTGKYLRVTGAPDSAKNVETESGYQNINVFLKQANKPDSLTRAIDSVRTRRFTFEPKL